LDGIDVEREHPRIALVQAAEVANDGGPVRRVRRHARLETFGRSYAVEDTIFCEECGNLGEV